MGGDPVNSRGSLLISRRDLEFVLFEFLRVDELTRTERYEQHSRATFDAILDLSADIAEQHFASHNQSNDTIEPKLVDGVVEVNPDIKKALKVLSRSGLMAATFDEEVGGLQLPETIAGACWMWLLAANSTTTAYPMLALGGANLLLAHGTPDDAREFVDPMIEGRFLGTMCLSEPPQAAHRSALSVPGRFPTKAVCTGCLARRCGSRVATTISPRISCTLFSHESTEDRKAVRVYLYSLFRRHCRTTVMMRNEMMSCVSDSITRWGFEEHPMRY